VTTLDCLGQRCPRPIIELARAIRTVTAGDSVRVLADDPAAANDIRAWCRMTGHEFVAQDGTAFVIRRVS
jgi:tRNA 2-thiouridine synthesizing protein A